MDGRDLFPLAPSTWQRTTLGDICRRGGGSIQTGPFGSQLHASDYVPVGIPSIMPVNIGDNRIVPGGIARIREADAERLSRHRVRPGDVIYSRRGDVERRALIRGTEDGWLCGTGCLKVRFGHGVINPAFASFYLGHPEIRSWIVRHAVGATMPNLNTAIMEAIPFLLPPITQQDQIADILGSLDDKIELNRRMNETLEAMARRLFKSWFVDFDPVHAKAALRREHPKLSNADLSRRALPQMAPEIAELFPDGFEKSTLGAIPKGWKAGPIGDLADLDKSSVTPSAYPDELFDHYSIPAFDDGMNPVTESGRKIKSNKFLVTADCVLLTKLNPRIPRVWFPFPSPSRRSLCSTEFLVLKPKEGVPREFLFSLVSSRPFFELYETMVTGTSGSHQRIQPEHLLKMDVLIPAESVRTCFTDAVCNEFKHTETLRSESRSLASTRDNLLPALLSGHLVGNGPHTHE